MAKVRKEVEKGYKIRWANIGQRRTLADLMNGKSVEVIKMRNGLYTVLFADSSKPCDDSIVQGNNFIMIAKDPKLIKTCKRFLAVG